MNDIRSMTQQEITDMLRSLGEPAFRGRQLFSWLQKGAESFDEMTNLSKPLREKLRETCLLTPPVVARKQTSRLDGTVKYLWELADGTITDYPMGFAQYRAVKAQEKAPQPVKAPEKKGDTRPPRGNRSQQAARRQLTICETGISKLEAECRRLDEEMAAHACDAGELNRLYQEKQEVESRLEREMARWEELSLQIEE